ncbi:MAG: aldo/keto reductase [Mycobacteriales bacterium]
MAESPTTPSSDQPTANLSNGAQVPLLGFGTWQLREKECYDAVRSALDVGYRHLDTATGYENEEQVGRAIRDSGLDRSEVFITTKLPPENAGKEAETLAASLRNLGVDYVDLWLIHWPPTGEAGVETWREFLALQGESKTRAIGVSNYSTEQVDELIDATGVAPAVNQIRWAPALFDKARADHLKDRGVALEGYSPFRASDLDDEALTTIADTHNASVPQVILRWHLEHEYIAIPKSAKPERIKANFDVFGFSLTPDEVATIDALSTI